MRSSRHLLLRVAGAVAAAAALTATGAGPAYADRLDDGDDGSVRTASDSDESTDSDDREADSDDRKAERDAAERAEEAREAAAERAEADRERSADTDRGTDRDTDRDDVPGIAHRNRAATSDGPADDRAGDRTPNRTNDRAGEPTDRAPAAPPVRKQRKHQGVYGLDRDPGSLAKDNLDGRTDPPGVYYPGLGTIEAPGIDSR